jgi:hypothetical protein
MVLNIPGCDNGINIIYLFLFNLPDVAVDRLLSAPDSHI